MKSWMYHWAWTWASLLTAGFCAGVLFSLWIGPPVWPEAVVVGCSICLAACLFGPTLTAIERILVSSGVVPPDERDQGRGLTK